MSVFLAQHARYLGPARIPGRLYEITWHPGLMQPQNSDDTVLGDLYQLHHGLFGVLDDYEGRGFPRRIMPVTLENGRRIDAWVYFYAGLMFRRKRIAGGDWCRAGRLRAPG
jgi:gamma-glutamylcyclotransferase (GGCT)/AIG2-like uncharacterized protein YtfP